MLISADVRPRNLKRGVSTKKLCQALGFNEQVGLGQLCGRLEFSAEKSSEFAFLTALFDAFHPVKGQASKVTVEIDGVPRCSYTQENKA